MLINFRNISLCTLCFFAIALSAWSILISPQNNAHPVVYNVTDTDSFMKDVNASVINTDGKIVLRIIAPKMMHFKHNDKTEIENPHVLFYRQGPEPWVIESIRAHTNKGLEEILFIDDVHISHIKDNENPDTSLKTKSLTVIPQKQTAMTKDTIEFIQPDTVIHATGMTANLATGAIELLSQAKGEYVPFK